MKTSILIVDDHTLVREAWAMVFSMDKRFEVIGQCSSGEEAVEKAKILYPDVIIMDINLPGINGIEATELIMKHNPYCKILGVSLHTQPTYVKIIMSKGARGYVTKNSTREEMFTAVEEILKGSKYICAEINSIISEQLLEDKETSGGFNELTPREVKIISLIKEGYSSKEIGAQLGLAEKTIQVYRYNIFKKLKVKNRAGLINLVSNSTSIA